MPLSAYPDNWDLASPNRPRTNSDNGYRLESRYRKLSGKNCGDFKISVVTRASSGLADAVQRVGMGKFGVLYGVKWGRMGYPGQYNDED